MITMAGALFMVEVLLQFLRVQNILLRPYHIRLVQIPECLPLIYKP